MIRDPRSQTPSTQPVLAAICESQVYRDFERAFTRATGLPLTLHEAEMINVPRYARGMQNPFCALMAKTNQSCAASYALQQKLEQEAQFQPKTLKDFAGLCETAVPLRVGENLIGFLHTGQVLLHHPSKARFSHIAETLVKSGAEIDLKRAEEAWFNTRVLTPKRYKSLIRLLTLFAEQLASCADQFTMRNEDAMPPAVSRARAYIARNYREDLRLAAVAKVVGMSANYFSGKFKEATGINFADHVARTRLEKARNLLQNPNQRISEIAFDIGFRSLSQFNRVFKRVTGQSPRDYRVTLASGRAIQPKAALLVRRAGPSGSRRAAHRPEEMRSISVAMRSSPLGSGDAAP